MARGDQEVSIYITADSLSTLSAPLLRVPGADESWLKRRDQGGKLIRSCARRRWTFARQQIAAIGLAARLDWPASGWDSP